MNILWRPHISETPSARCRQCGVKGFFRSCRTNLKLKTQKRKFLFKAEELGDDCGDSFHLFTTQSMIKTFIRIYTSFVCFSMFNMTYQHFHSTNIELEPWQYSLEQSNMFQLINPKGPWTHYMECYPSNCWEQCIKKDERNFLLTKESLN